MVGVGSSSAFLNLMVWSPRLGSLDDNSILGNIVACPAMAALVIRRGFDRCHGSDFGAVEDLFGDVGPMLNMELISAVDGGTVSGTVWVVGPGWVWTQIARVSSLVRVDFIGPRIGQNPPIQVTLGEYVQVLEPVRGTC